MLISDLRGSPVLFHGYKELKYFCQAMNENRMAGSSVQRYWDDGKRRKDDDPEYRGSKWMKGLSLTRDIRYAMGWGRVVIALDADALRKRHRIIPYNWGYSIPNNPVHKREREEFLVTHMGGTYTQEEDPTRMDTKTFMQPEGEVKNLSSILKGIWVEDCVVVDDPTDRYTMTDYYQRMLSEGGYPLEKILSHPAFRGYYNSKRGFVNIDNPTIHPTKRAA